jgi:hypothetical protein
MYHNNGRVINKQVEAEGRTSLIAPYKGRVPSAANEFPIAI